MEYIPWFVWIVIAAIIAGTIVTVSTSRGTGRNELAQALKQNAEANEKLVARLDGMDLRLTSVEKTLNEIPE
ncbi:MAG: hypothetical protein BGN97_16110 [Microbacterium sp. 69-10]|uniref:hypothetical protein n=1 Tax=Microbacterium sp. 69-10 TaxID=1895783 RepID=UPI000969B6C9|nr:hypothetical protein [Microbacterium sp. 69-10]OJU41257.1 MAG: hypothetical protein BGN97_16110 [Microbacterium sp. 69-10]